MKLKDLLIEKEKNWEKIAKDIIRSDEWVDPDPTLYRGKSKKQRDPVFARKTRTDRNPLDTHSFVHKVVNSYHEICYSKFPDRSEVKFATTNAWWAREFGEQVFVVLPHKDAIVYNSKKDPVHEFDSAEDGFLDFQERIRKWKQDGGEVKFLDESLKGLVKIFNSREVDVDFLRRWECPKEMVKRLDRLETEMELEDKHNWIASLLKFYENIKTYFERLEFGYPDNNDDRHSDEVCFKGEYVMIKEELYEKVK